MSISLKRATRIISHRASETLLTRNTLYNMLIDLGAFKGSSVLKVAVKNLIETGFWNKVAIIYQNKTHVRGQIDIIKHQIMTTFGYSENIVDIILNSIWDVDEWDNGLISSDPESHLYFEGIPIYGTTIDFVEKLISKGYGWNWGKQCLVGCYQKIDNRFIFCNESCSEIPLYSVSVVFPKITPIEKIFQIKQSIIETALQRNPLYSQNPYFMDGDYIRVYKHDNTTELPQLIICDPCGQDIMVESFAYDPSKNNLTTID